MKTISIILLSSCLFISQGIAQEVVLPADSLMRKKAIKMEFFSPLTGNLTLGYEQYLGNFTSLEFKVGFIGVGKQDFADRREAGLFISGGPKFKLKPEYAQKGTFSTHLLRGGYIRPEVTFASHKYYRDREFNPAYGETATSVALTINYGKQWVLGDIMTMDWHIGMGYGYTSTDEADYYYRTTWSGGDLPIAWTAGFTIGVLLK
ncbi:MAG: DUF3575 domain-containing protein [Cyclobacteriaceae bacterium]